jgi:hypothetical protein
MLLDTVSASVAAAVSAPTSRAASLVGAGVLFGGGNNIGNGDAADDDATSRSHTFSRAASEAADVPPPVADAFGHAGNDASEIFGLAPLPQATEESAVESERVLMVPPSTSRRYQHPAAANASASHQRQQQNQSQQMNNRDSAPSVAGSVRSTTAGLAYAQQQQRPTTAASSATDSFTHQQQVAMSKGAGVSLADAALSAADAGALAELVDGQLSRRPNSSRASAVGVAPVSASVLTGAKKRRVEVSFLEEPTY